MHNGDKVGTQTRNPLIIRRFIVRIGEPVFGGSSRNISDSFSVIMRSVGMYSVRVLVCFNRHL